MNRKSQIEIQNLRLRTDQSRSPKPNIFSIFTSNHERKKKERLQTNVQAFGSSGKEKVRETSSVSEKLHRRMDHYTDAAGNRTAESAAEHQQTKEKWSNQRGGEKSHGDDRYRKLYRWLS